MLKKREAPRCPGCGGGLIVRGVASLEASSFAESGDRHWLCPGCGISRPMVYVVERTNKKAS